MRTFLMAAINRAVRTLAQTALATIGTSAMFNEVDWVKVASTSALAALLSILTSISTGLPEASATGEEEDD